MERAIGARGPGGPRGDAVVVHPIQHGFGRRVARRTQEAQRIGHRPQSACPFSDDTGDETEGRDHPAPTADHQRPGSRSHGGPCGEGEAEVAAHQAQSGQIPGGAGRAVEEFDELPAGRGGFPEDLREDHRKPGSNGDLEATRRAQGSRPVVGHAHRDRLGRAPRIVVGSPLEQAAHRIDGRPGGRSGLEREPQGLRRQVRIIGHERDAQASPLLDRLRGDRGQGRRLIGLGDLQEEFTHHRERLGRTVDGPDQHHHTGRPLGFGRGPTGGTGLRTENEPFRGWSIHLESDRSPFRIRCFQAEIPRRPLDQLLGARRLEGRRIVDLQHPDPEHSGNRERGHSGIANPIGHGLKGSPEALIGSPENLALRRERQAGRQDSLGLEGQRLRGSIGIGRLETGRELDPLFGLQSHFGR